MPDKLHVLITFALEPELIETLQAVDRDRIEVEVLGPTERRLLRGIYPSELEREAVAHGLHDAFQRAEVVFGFWGTDLHYALTHDATAIASAKRELAGERSIREAAPRLKWIQLTSAGADRLLGSGAIEDGITVTTVSGLHATPIGEFVLASMLMFAKGAHIYTRAQARHEWARFAPTELYGKTVGIVGMGHIGEEVARLAKAFGCRVIATRRSVTEAGPAGHADDVMPASDLHRLLGESDYIVLAMPLTPETRGMIGEAELRAMKPTAVLVNIARGPVTVEAALLQALREGWIKGAALDVFDEEPLPAEHPLWDMDNVILSPHISGGTEIYNRRATEIFAANLRRYLDAATLANVVDPARGY